MAEDYRGWFGPYAEDVNVKVPWRCNCGDQLRDLRESLESLRAEVARLEAGRTRGKPEPMNAIHYSS